MNRQQHLIAPDLSGWLTCQRCGCVADRTTPAACLAAPGERAELTYAGVPLLVLAAGLSASLTTGLVVFAAKGHTGDPAGAGRLAMACAALGLVLYRWHRARAENRSLHRQLNEATAERGDTQPVQPSPAPVIPGLTVIHHNDGELGLHFCATCRSPWPCTSAQDLTRSDITSNLETPTLTG